MNLNELKSRHPEKFAEWEKANADLAGARDQVRPHNHECGALWAEVEKAQAAYQEKRKETEALERKLRVKALAKKVAALAREISGL